jgi:hypothetical protein
LAEAEQRKRYHDAVRKATLQYALVERLVSVMKPVFAMGPAWSVMRAVAFWRKVPQPIVDAHRGDAFLKYELFQYSLSEIEETSGETILRGLHVMMGDPVFEARLHMALYDCVAEFSEEIESRQRGMVLDYATVRRRPGDDEAAVGRLGALSGLLRQWRRAGKKREGPWTHGPDDLGNSAALLDKNEAG